MDIVSAKIEYANTKLSKITVEVEVGGERRSYCADTRKRGGYLAIDPAMELSLHLLQDVANYGMEV